MKNVLKKTAVVVAGGVLVVPFVAAAALVGARAVAGAGSAKQFLLLVALALVWTFLGGVKNSKRDGDDGRDGNELLVAPRRAKSRRHAFLQTRGLKL
ncbi:MAG: hypothetical protein DMF65_11445 [Acidobacteria bacterium]|nr:MAG: hypothetical protein DMF65_11445 [Acidobacteriota bacterium]